MSKVEALESEIRRLSANEFAQLRDWLLEQDAERWDRQFEEDANSGKLDSLFAKAEADHHAGKSREL